MGALVREGGRFSRVRPGVESPAIAALDGWQGERAIAPSRSSAMRIDAQQHVIRDAIG
jgi:hypothetical protein